MINIGKWSAVAGSKSSALATWVSLTRARKYPPLVRPAPYYRPGDRKGLQKDVKIPANRSDQAVGRHALLRPLSIPRSTASGSRDLISDPPMSMVLKRFRCCSSNPCPVFSYYGPLVSQSPPPLPNTSQLSVGGICAVCTDDRLTVVHSHYRETSSYSTEPEMKSILS